MIVVKAAAARASIVLGVQAGAGKSWRRKTQLRWGGRRTSRAGSWSFFPRGNCLLKLLVEGLKAL